MLNTIKLYLGLTDDLQDGLLEQIIADATRQVIDYIDTDTLPEKLEWIVRELSIVRYNRIGNEGMKDEWEEGRKATYDEDAFSRFVPYLDKYLEDTSHGRGKVKFL